MKPCYKWNCLLLAVLTFSTVAFGRELNCALTENCTYPDLVNYLRAEPAQRGDERLETGDFTLFPGWTDIALVEGSTNQFKQFRSLWSPELLKKIQETSPKDLRVRFFEIESQYVMHSPDDKFYVPYAIDVYTKRTVMDAGYYIARGVIETNADGKETKVTVERIDLDNDFKDMFRNGTLPFGKTAMDLKFAQLLIPPLLESYLSGNLAFIGDNNVAHGARLAQLLKVYGPNRPNIANKPKPETKAETPPPPPQEPTVSDQPPAPAARPPADSQ